MKMKDAIATSWLRLMAARHGILPTIDSVVAGESQPPSLMSKLAPIALSVLLGGGVATGAAWLLNRGEDTKAPEQDGSLLQYLEDRGDHQPL